jgi:VWFA-related protein
MSIGSMRSLMWLLLCVGVSAAQSSQPTIEELNNPALRVTTRAVLVDVVVTDKSGQRVKGLSQNDFTVLENGKTQKIAMFSFESRGQEPRPQTPALPANVYTNRPEYDMPPGPLTIILIDGINTPVDNQGYARSQMLKYLSSQLQPGQPVAVYLLANSLTLLQDFTDNIALLKAAVEGFTPEKSLELQMQQAALVLPSMHITGDTSARGPSGDVIRLALIRMNGFLQEQTRFAIEARVQRTTAALQLLAKRMAGYPGRKNLIWVSAGFPIQITSQVVQMTTDVQTLAENAVAPSTGLRVEDTFEEALHRLAAELTDAQVSVYSVDARGLVGSTLANASSSGTNEMGLLRIGADYGAQVARSGAAGQASQDTLLTLASESGGLLFKNQNDIAGALATSVADGSSYYLLGYYPDSKQWDGKFRKIQVKLNRPGLEVRHRTGYFAKDPTQWAKNKDKNDPELNAAMGMGAPPSTMVIFDSRVIPPAPAAKVKVPVEFLVNTRTISGEEMKDGGRHFIVEFHVAAYSPQGKMVTHKDAGIDAPIKPDRLQAYLQQGIPFRTELELAAGEYRLRLGVRDGRTGFIGTTEIPLTLASK